MDTNQQRQQNIHLEALKEEIKEEIEVELHERRGNIVDFAEEVGRILAEIMEQYQPDELSSKDLKVIVNSVIIRDMVSQLPEVTVPEREHRKLQQQLDKIRQQDRRENAKYFEAEYRSLLGTIHKKVAHYPKDFLNKFRSALPEIRKAQEKLITYYIRQDVINNITDNMLLDIRNNLLDLAEKLPLNNPPEGLEAQELINYLIALYTRSQDLDRGDKYPIIVELMRLGGVARERGEAPGIQDRVINPGQLCSAIKPIVEQPAPAGARPLPTQESLALLVTFLTTPKSMSEMARESNGQWSVAGIRKNLNTTLGRVWEDIPPQDRQGFETAQEAMQAVIASPIKTEEARRKMGIQPGWKEDRPRRHTQNARKKPGEAKREFSGNHIQRLKQAASDRWRRHREEKAAQANQP